MEKKKLGVYYNTPRENAPDFVKGSVAVHLETLIEAAKGFVNEKGYVYLDFLKGEPKEFNASGLYFKLNEFKPNKPKDPASLMKQGIEQVTDNFEIPTEQIPF